MEEDHYAVLGISDEEADEDQIKKAFRKLAKEVHPDKNPGISSDVYRRVQRARDVLLDPKLREAHNISRRHRMKHRGEGVSKGRVHKEKDKKSGPGTFFKSKGAPSKGAAGSWHSSEFKKFTQDATDNKETPNFKEYAQRSKFNFSFGQKTKDEQETPNFAGNAQSNANQFSSGPEAKAKKETPNFAGNARSTAYNFSFDQNAKDKKETPNFGSNAQSTQHDFPGSHYAKNTKNDANFAGNARSTAYNFSFDQGAKDKKETPNFGGNAQSTQHNFPGSHDAKNTKNDPNFAGGAEKRKYDFSSSQDTKDKKGTPNFAEYAKRSQFNFSFGGPNTEKKEGTPNFAEHAKRSKFNFSFGSPNAEKKKDSGAESMHEEDLPHKKPFGWRGAQASSGTGAGRSTLDADNTTDEPYVHEVFLTLEDVANGCIKDMGFSRSIKLEDGSTGEEEMVLSFEVKKGWKAGTKVTFGKADQKWKNAPRDIVFIMRDRAHPVFTRDGSNLLYTAYVSAAQVDLGSPIEIPTLGGGKKSLIITPDFVDDPNLLKSIKGEGLPFPKEPTKKGDLIVKFVSAS